MSGHKCVNSDYSDYGRLNQCDECGWWWLCTHGWFSPDSPASWNRRPAWWGRRIQRRRDRKDRKHNSAAMKRIEQHQRSKGNQ